MSQGASNATPPLQIGFQLKHELWKFILTGPGGQILESKL
jgi:hypothetical protein